MLPYGSIFRLCYIGLRKCFTGLVDKVAHFFYNEVKKKKVITLTMGEKILKLRKARQWSQEELAEKIGVTRQAVSRWEAGSAKPDADKIIAVCELFGVSADYLLRENYAGETGSVSVQTQRQTTALGDAIRAMTLKQWAALGLLLGGGLLMFALKLIYIFVDTNYYYVDINGCSYYGFEGFLRSAGVTSIWYTAMIAALAGGYLILWPVVKNWFLKNVWKKIGEFFNWD